MTKLDELLELMKEEAAKRDESQKAELNSCEKFIKKNGITKGLERVPNYVIFYTYMTNFKDKSKESKHQFFRLFNPHFEQKRTGKQRVYMLDGKSFDLTREGLLKAKDYDKEYKEEVSKRRGTAKKARIRRLAYKKEDS